MRSDDISILTPADELCKFFEGEEQTLAFYLKNNSDHTIRDIEFTVKTIKPDGNETTNKYVKIGELPKVILAGKSEKIDVTVKIPLDYDEKCYSQKAAKDVVVPFRLHSFVEGKKYIEEL